MLFLYLLCIPLSLHLVYIAELGVAFLYSGSLWSSLYSGVSSLWVGLYKWFVKVSWVGKLGRCSGEWSWISSLWSELERPMVAAGGRHPCLRPGPAAWRSIPRSGGWAGAGRPRGAIHDEGQDSSGKEIPLVQGKEQ